MHRIISCTVLPGLIALVALLAAATPTTSQTAPAGVNADPIEMLLDEIEVLEAQIEAMRVELAAAKLEAATAQRELAELKQFLEDHHELGRDFQEYRAIKAIAEQEARERRVQEMREQRAAERARRQEARRAEDAAAPERREQRYNEAGFTAIGNDVYVSRMAFYYRSQDSIPYRFDYFPGIGRYQRFYPPQSQVDFSSMTISGSVLNGGEETRNIGIAVAFFDEAGNQVGGETVQVNNARPNVPYPFSAELTMALDRPFASASTYVLYADPIPPSSP